jgi:hypothetical protein
MAIFVPVASDRQRAENDLGIKLPVEQVVVRHNRVLPGVMGSYVNDLVTEIEMPLNSFNSWKGSYTGLKTLVVPQKIGVVESEYQSLSGMDYGSSSVQRLSGNRVLLTIQASRL